MQSMVIVLSEMNHAMQENIAGTATPTIRTKSIVHISKPQENRKTMLVANGNGKVKETITI